MELAAVILAAGKGTRMRSDLPKVLHKICGKPMIHYVLEGIKGAGIERIIVIVGHQGELVAQNLPQDIKTVLQEPQLGTAHALLQAKEELTDFRGDILVMSADTPLVGENLLSDFLGAHRRSGAMITVLTAALEEPAGYGRVVRDSSGKVVKIVEQKDANSSERNIKEINGGIYCFSSAGLFESLGAIGMGNAQKEYYLPDLIELYGKNKKLVVAYQAPCPGDIQGINDRRQLAEVESLIRYRKNEELMISGVTVIDPANTYIDRDVIIGRDSTVYPFTIIEGRSVFGENCSLGPGVHLRDIKAGKHVTIANSVAMESVIEDQCTIGPFAYIRPGCHLKQKVKIGDFVEIKKVTLGKRSKVPHLSYLGDTEVGCDVNVGAGTITCNYDGANKWPTHIGDGAFIGSNTNLVAPVEVGVKAVIGAGSTITKDVPPGALGITRSRQRNLEGWSARKKNRCETK